jgi:outer membrane protein
MKQLIGFAAGVLVVVAAGAAQLRSAAPTAVVVSLQRITAQSNTGKKAIQQLETMKQDRGRELVAKQKELEGVVKQLAAGGALPAAERDRLSQDEARRRAEFQQMTQQANADMVAAQQRLQQELRSQISPILADIAKQRGVDIIMNGDTIAWAAPATDATNEVLQRLNAAPQ